MKHFIVGRDVIKTGEIAGQSRSKGFVKMSTGDVVAENRVFDTRQEALDCIQNRTRLIVKITTKTCPTCGQIIRSGEGFEDAIGGVWKHQWC